MHDMRTSWKALFIMALLSASAALHAQERTFTVDCRSTPEAGWIAGGYGMLHFTFTNKGDQPVTVVALSGQWLIHGEPAPRKPWDWDVNQVVEAGGTGTFKLTSWMPPDVAEASTRSKPSVTISAKLTRPDGQAVSSEPVTVEVGVSSLPEPLRRIDAKHMGLELMTSRYKDFKHVREVLAFLDQTYLAMQDLTGFTPYDGKVLVIRECPDNPAWAYAGNPIMANTKFVGQTVEEFDRYEVSFGWIHEIGHCFDFGGWYIWNSPASEFQANFKLAYVFDTLLTPDSKFRARSWKPLVGNQKPLVLGRQFVDGHVIASGDEYLADTSRTWDTMNTDDLHAFFHRMVRTYGWEPFKRWYRTYDILAKAGLEKPADDAAKVQLICAILNRAIGVDQQPRFALWRFPVTPEDVARMDAKYDLARHVPAAKD